MTKYVETKMVEQTTVKFVAEDGKVFTGDNAERECAEYELIKNKNKIEEEFINLRPKWINIPLLDWFYDCDAEIVSLAVKDEIEYETTVKDYFKIKSPNYMDFEGFYDKKPKEFPCNIILVSGYEWVDVYSGGEKELKAELLKAVEKLS